MAIICNSSALVPTDETDSWFWQSQRYGTTARQKRRAGRPKYSDWTRPFQGTQFAPFVPHNRHICLYTSRQWSHNAYVVQGDWDGWSLSVTYTNAKGVAHLGNGFQLFMWYALPWFRQGFLLSEYWYNSPLLAPLYYQPSTPPTVFAAPTINAVSWSLSGTLDVSWLPAFSDSVMNYLISVVPPDRPHGIAHSALDIFAISLPGNPTPSYSIPRAWWNAALYGVQVGQQWQLMLRQTPGAFPNSQLSEPAFYNVTVAA